MDIETLRTICQDLPHVTEDIKWGDDLCFLIGGIETLGLISTEVKGLSTSGGFWSFMRDFNLNVAGFVIVGLFVLTWAGAVLVWRYGHIEEKWSAKLRAGGAHHAGSELS